MDRGIVILIALCIALGSALIIDKVRAVSQDDAAYESLGAVGILFDEVCRAKGFEGAEAGNFNPMDRSWTIACTNGNNLHIQEDV